VLYKELDRILAKNESLISINKAIEEINKMYEIEIHDSNNNKVIVQLKNNTNQQEIIDLINLEF
jgi:hypothetical protein